MSKILYFAEVKPENFETITQDLNKIIKDRFPNGIKIYEIDGECIGKAVKVYNIGEHYQNSLTAEFVDKTNSGNSIRVYHCPWYTSYLVLVNDELLLHIKADSKAK